MAQREISDSGTGSSEDESCDDSDCSSVPHVDGSDDGERRHFLDVCWSFMEYSKDAAQELARMQESIDGLDPQDLVLWNTEPKAWFTEVQWRAEVNGQFLKLLPVPEVCGVGLGENAEQVVCQVPDRHHVASRNSMKVNSTLQQLVRDWAREGEAERNASYAPLVSALLRHLPPQQGRRMPTVLCPGCGLGRLPFDLARYGYAAQGNEFSYHMLMGSHLILNRCDQAECHTIFPYAMSTANRSGKNKHLLAVKVPDLCPKQALPANAQLSMAAGEFVEVYKDHVCVWDAVATCFFLDTAKNVFLYIRTIAKLIPTGGCWTNIGPLLYHYADVEHEISIELSWEEVRPAICGYFDIIEESMQVCEYAANCGALSAVKYRCVFFVAIRNSVPPSGASHPVF